jgi:ketosteroid isomerase-like protein
MRSSRCMSLRRRLRRSLGASRTDSRVCVKRWGGFVAMKGTLDLKVTRVLEANDLALVAGVWTFKGTGPDGAPVTLEGHNADLLRRQADGSWRFVIDNPWGTA